jgi:hypothetical protein
VSNNTQLTEVADSKRVVKKLKVLYNSVLVRSGAQSICDRKIPTCGPAVRLVAVGPDMGMRIVQTDQKLLLNVWRDLK